MAEELPELPNLEQKLQAWDQAVVSLRILYSDGLQQYWDWLGDTF